MVTNATPEQTIPEEKNEALQVKLLEEVNDNPDEVKFDLRKFNKTENQVLKAKAALSTIQTISGKEDVTVALDIIKKAKQVTKVIEDKRKALGEPFREIVEKINAKAKEIISNLPTDIKRAEDVVLAYNKAEEEKRVKLVREARGAQLETLGLVKTDSGYSYKESINVAMARLDSDDKTWAGIVTYLTDQINDFNIKEAAKKQMEAEADNFFGEDLPYTPPVQVVEAPKPVKHVSSFGGSSSAVKGVTKRWTFSIEDPALIPREYLIPDEAKIREEMNKGNRSIPGVKYEQKESLTSR